MITLAEMAYLHGEKTQQRPYFLAAAIYSFAFLFPEQRYKPPSPYDPRLRLAADLYSFGLAHAFASNDDATVEFKSGGYQLPFGMVQVVVNPSAFEWRNRRIVALSPVQDIAIRGLANRYRRPGVGAPLAASTQPIVAEQGMQVAPRMKLPMTAVLRLDAPRRQLAQRELRATLDLYNTYDVATTTIGGKTVPLEADDTAVLAYVLASPEIWERELKAFFSGVFSEATPTQLASIDVYRPGRIPVVFVHGTASSAGRWGDMVNDLLDDPRIRERYQFWFFTYDTGNPVLYSAALLREALRDALHKLDPAGVDPALSEIVVIGHSQGGCGTPSPTSHSTRSTSRRSDENCCARPSSSSQYPMCAASSSSPRRIAAAISPNIRSPSSWGDFLPSPCVLSRQASNLRAMPAISRSTHAISDRAACSA